MNLPQTTIDRIEKEADIFAEIKQAEITEPYNTYVDLYDGYETGAKAEATRALPLNEALRRAIGIIESECDDIELLTDLKEVIVKYSIASYESGEPVEPANARPAGEEIFQKGLVLIECVNQLEGTYVHSGDFDNKMNLLYQRANELSAACVAYTIAKQSIEPVQGKEAKEFGRWMTINCCPYGDGDYYMKADGHKPIEDVTAYNVDELYSIWQQSQKQQS